ncbi:diguanylate cyclase domain-containing protein [Microbulbifer litoralis]|uniref:diguanylate cyclase domain-containing protein n=1 Tax=Microbulbifer litoralis TaxID=2933965 RepID=UPI002028EAD3|nr:diguanylate cyclase [Microbulbifer sp. GX H0434]
MTPELVSLLNTYSVPSGICDGIGNWIALSSKLQTLLAGERHHSLADHIASDAAWQTAWTAINRNRQIHLVDTVFTGPLSDRLARVTRVDFLDAADITYLVEFLARSDAPAAPARQLQVAAGGNTVDPVTGLPEYDVFARQLEHQWKLAVCQRTSLSLLLLETGPVAPAEGKDVVARAQRDSAMQCLARCLERNAGRWSDFVARIGKHEFALILAGTDPTGIGALTRRLAQAIDSLRWRDRPLSEWLSVSIGGHSCRPTPQATAGTLLLRARQALKSARERDERCAITWSEAPPQRETVDP